ncbi:hypothetical protein [Methylobacterium nigriterrae]|uniref:hypothetical protein n=1 Tax=Methylobacterium nigriterrae TaxID=3127512 RepID=UPI00301400CD
MRSAKIRATLILVPQGQPVYFEVSATDAARAVAFQRTSMTEALDKALALVGSGLADVIITRPCGARHTPSEFLAAYLSAQELRRPGEARPALAA